MSVGAFWKKGPFIHESFGGKGSPLDMGMWLVHRAAWKSGKAMDGQLWAWKSMQGLGTVTSLVLGQTRERFLASESEEPRGGI